MRFFIDLKEMISEIAENRNIKKETIRICLYEQNGSMLVNVFDGTKEISCSLLIDEI